MRIDVGGVIRLLGSYGRTEDVREADGILDELAGRDRGLPEAAEEGREGESKGESGGRGEMVDGRARRLNGSEVESLSSVWRRCDNVDLGASADCGIRRGWTTSELRRTDRSVARRDTEVFASGEDGRLLCG